MAARVEKRKRNLKHDNINGITKPAIRRLARRGGVKRLPEFIYDEIRKDLLRFLHAVIKEAVIHAEYKKGKTITEVSIVRVLERRGHKLYGYKGL